MLILYELRIDSTCSLFHNKIYSGLVDCAVVLSRYKIIRTIYSTTTINVDSNVYGDIYIHVKCFLSSRRIVFGMIHDWDARNVYHGLNIDRLFLLSIQVYILWLFLTHYLSHTMYSGLLFSIWFNDSTVRSTNLFTDANYITVFFSDLYCTAVNTYDQKVLEK